MADLTYAVISSAVNTSTGTQDFTKSGFGTAKAALGFIVREATQDTVPGQDASIGAGFAIGTGANDEFSMAVQAQDAQSTTSTDRLAQTDEFLSLLPGGSATPDFEANFDSFITDGIRINIGAVGGSPEAWRVIIILFGGGDLSVDSLNDNVVSSASPINSLAHDPDLIFAMGLGSTIPVSGAQNIFSIGAAYNTGSGNEEGMLCTSSRDVVGTTVLSATLRDDAFTGQAFNDAFTWNIALNAWVTGGFSYTLTGSSSTDDFALMSMNLGGGKATVRVITIPTGTGTASFSGWGFKPGLVIAMGGIYTAKNTLFTTNTATGGFYGVTDGTTESCVVHGEQDNTGTSNTYCGQRDKFMSAYGFDGSLNWEANLDSFDSDGMTIDITDATTSTRVVLIIAFEEGSGGAATMVAATAAGIASRGGTTVFAHRQATASGLASVVAEIAGFFEASAAATAAAIATAQRTTFAFRDAAAQGIGAVRKLIITRRDATAEGVVTVGFIKFLTRVVAATAAGVGSVLRATTHNARAIVAGIASKGVWTVFHNLVAIAAGVAFKGAWTVFHVVRAAASGIASAADQIVGGIIERTVAATAAGVVTVQRTTTHHVAVVSSGIASVSKLLSALASAIAAAIGSVTATETDAERIIPPFSGHGGLGLGRIGRWTARKTTWRPRR